MNTFGRRLRMHIIGESHGMGVGVVLDGVPPGIAVDKDRIQQRMGQRRPGTGPLVSSRQEKDDIHLSTGVFDGHTTGAPVTLWISNEDTRSKDYDVLRRTPRPGHSDWIAHHWSRGFYDHRGGGHYSGRLTAPIVAAAALLEPMLEQVGIAVGAHLHTITGFGGHDGGPVLHQGVESWGPESVAHGQAAVAASTVHTAHTALEDAFVDAIDKARRDGDSLGAVVAWQGEGVPKAWGDPFFDSIESHVAHMLFSIPAVKGVSFGAGFRAATMRGSQHNDPIAPDGSGSNWAGGILGGRSTGRPIWGHVAIKPTSSIFQPQQTVDMETGEPATLELKGRHDPCIGVRAVPVVRAAVELALVDFLLLARQQGHAEASP